MDIPNYDSSDKLDNGFTQLHKFMPKNTFRMLIAGNSFYGCPKAIRLNCSHFCLCDFPSSRERNLISQELGINKEMYIKATNKPYSFCYVDKPMKTVKRNFYGNI